MDWYLTMILKYTDFSSRAKRDEFWPCVLFNTTIVCLLAALESLVNQTFVIASIFIALILIPSLAVGARRLHDTGRSGWWLLLNFIPVLGQLVLFYFFAQPSHETEKAVAEQQSVKA